MNPAHNEAVEAVPGPWWLRLHRALMPDYNRQAALYWWAMVLLGALILAHTLSTLL